MSTVKKVSNSENSAKSIVEDKKIFLSAFCQNVAGHTSYIHHSYFYSCFLAALCLLADVHLLSLLVLSTPVHHCEPLIMSDFYRSKKKKKATDSGSLTHQKPYGGGNTAQRHSNNTDSASSTFQQGPSQWTNRLSPEWLKANGKPRTHTLSVAIPGSIIRKAQTLGESLKERFRAALDVVVCSRVFPCCTITHSPIQYAPPPRLHPSVHLSSPSIITSLQS